MENKQSNDFRYYLTRYTYYLIIAILVSIALIFMPMFDPNGTFKLQMPDSSLGVIAYCLVRVLVGVIVFMIFVSFDKQGKVNIKDDPLYIEAYNILMGLNEKEYIPVSPKTYLAKTYGFKALTLSISTIVGAFVLMECVLTYNYVVLLTYVVSILMSIITGIFQMKKAELYWTEEYNRYAHYVLKKVKEEELMAKQLADQVTKTVKKEECRNDIQNWRYNL